MRGLAGRLILTAIAFGFTHPSMAADATRGAERFRVLCGACHAIEPGVRKISSPMRGIIGRKAASVPGIAYSTALSTSGWVWSKTKLEPYLENPKKAMPGTTMMAATPNATDRADIIAYLASLQ